MAKCNRETHPQLFGYLDAYGLDPKVIERIDRIRENGHYALLGYPDDEGLVHMLDLAKAPDNDQTDYRDKSSMAHYGYNMLNDGMDEVTEKEWNKVKLDPHRDSFIIPGHEEYGQW